MQVICTNKLLDTIYTQPLLEVGLASFCYIKVFSTRKIVKVSQVTKEQKKKQIVWKCSSSFSIFLLHTWFIPRSRWKKGYRTMFLFWTGRTSSIWTSSKKWESAALKIRFWHRLKLLGHCSGCFKLFSSISNLERLTVHQPMIVFKTASTSLHVNLTKTL